MENLSSTQLIRQGAENMRLSIQKENDFKVAFKLGHLVNQQTDAITPDQAIEAALENIDKVSHLDALAEVTYRMLNVPKV